MEASSRLELALLQRRILVVAGSGGVGKTTTAAALGLRAAVLGRRVLVCTIDPSRRLATSLGLDRLPDRPRHLDLSRLECRGAGELWAMALDTKRTFDALVLRHAPSEEASRHILGNPFYQELSSALSGSNEYMAMEKLLELSADERFDLVVLDTPPTRHALDFLEAPQRMLGFLDQSVLRWLLRPYFVAGRLTFKVATRTGALALQMADRVLGLKFLQDVSEFFLAFDGMYEGFKERAARVFELLRDPATAFVVVTSPAPFPLEEALYFRRRLEEGGLPFLAFVVNRVHPAPSPAAGRGPTVEVEPGLAQALVLLHADQWRVARADARAVASLEERTGDPVVAVPEFEQDVHEMSGLCEVGAAIFGPSARPPLPRTRSRLRGASGRRPR